jgi:leucyl aminopeptidase
MSLVAKASRSIPIHLVNQGGLEAWRAALPAPSAAYVKAIGFAAKPGSVALLPAADGALAAVAMGVAEAGGDPFLIGKLPKELPPGAYHLADPSGDLATLALAWLLGSYGFHRYKPEGRKAADLVILGKAVRDRAALIAEAVALGRDLINTPANDLGPAELEGAARELAGRFGAGIEVIAGDELLAKGYPAVHAVGRAAAPGREPEISVTARRSRDGHRAGCRGGLGRFE